MVERAAGKNVLDSLRPSERDVLVLLAQGLSNTEIANRLNVEKVTVTNRITSIFSYLYTGDTNSEFDSRVRASLIYQENTPDFENPFNGFEFKGTLSAGQRDIVIFIGQGYSNEGIANRLHFSVRTVEGTVNMLSAELRIDRRAYATRVVLALISQTSNFLSQNAEVKMNSILAHKPSRA